MNNQINCIVLTTLGYSSNGKQQTDLELLTKVLLKVNPTFGVLDSSRTEEIVSIVEHNAQIELVINLSRPPIKILEKISNKLLSLYPEIVPDIKVYQSTADLEDALQVEKDIRKVLQGL